jgi:hypothetical protein
MTETGDIEAIRAEALRKVGRNVVNFQKVESCLKYLVIVSNVQGTLTTVTDHQREKRARVRKESLGNLARALHRDIFEDGAESHVPPDISEMWMSVSMKVVADADAIKQQKRALSALVAERNKLIHHDLVHFDHNSMQSCRDLIHILDMQNPRILEQLNVLKVLIDTFKTNIADMQAWVDSDEFLRYLQPVPMSGRGDG